MSEGLNPPYPFPDMAVEDKPQYDELFIFNGLSTISLGIPRG
jgi:hypothetical protein